MEARYTTSVGFGSSEAASKQPILTRDVSSGSSHKEVEFERFVDLARKIVRVPKAEIDAKRDEI